MIIVMRHSESIGNFNDKLDPGYHSKLSKDADFYITRSQKEIFKKYNIEKVFSSDILRAKETANRFTNREVEITKELREIDFGEMKNSSNKDFLHSKYSYNRIPGGESYSDVLGRALEFIRSTSVGGRLSLYVTHGGVICSLLHFLNGEDLNLFPGYKIDYCGYIAIEGDRIIDDFGIVKVNQR